MKSEDYSKIYDEEFEKEARTPGILAAGNSHRLKTAATEAMRRAYLQGRDDANRDAEPGEAGCPPPKDWTQVPVTMDFLADLFDAYSGEAAHNLVVSVAAGRIGQHLR